MANYTLVNKGFYEVLPDVYVCPLRNKRGTYGSIENSQRVSTEIKRTCGITKVRILHLKAL